MRRRGPVNVSLPIDLVDRAKRLGINISRAAEEGLSEAIARTAGPSFRFGVLKDRVAPPPLEVFAPMTDEELDGWGL